MKESCPHNLGIPGNLNNAGIIGRITEIKGKIFSQSRRVSYI